MKRIRVDDDNDQSRKKCERVRCDDRKPRSLKRIRVPKDQIEADPYVLWHLARIKKAKEVEKDSWAQIAGYLALKRAPADFE